MDPKAKGKSRTRNQNMHQKANGKSRTGNQNMHQKANGKSRTGNQNMHQRQETELTKAIEKEINDKKEKVMLTHNQKIQEAREKVDKAKKLHPVGNTLTEEITALEHKLQELKEQKKEFNSAVRCIREKIHTLLEADNPEEEVQNVRKKLDVECFRLEQALPVYASRQELVNTVKEHPVSILLAETGSGESTQVSQYLLEAGLAEKGSIVCTQPRKVATSSLAIHLGQDTASGLGQDVGHQTSGGVGISASNRVLYMTTQALLNECLKDPDLTAFSCLVVDDAHERSLFTDIVLATIKRCLQRPDFHLLIVLSPAAADPQVFVRFFGGNCPVLSVKGTTFPVDVVWQDPVSEEGTNFENYVEAAVQTAVEIHEKEPPGDILVFVTTAWETQRCCATFQQKMADRTDFQCFQMHEQLQAEERQKVLQPLEGTKRKIVFTTICAETSITVDGIKYVVDTGVAKEMRYNPKRNLRSLNMALISQISAEQRKRLAGRTAPGKCYRLYSQRSFQAMEVDSLPEILKVPLGHAVLKLAELDVTLGGDNFVQPPSQEAIDAALKTLHQLGAMEMNVITDKGRWIARLPFDPRHGLMTWYGRDCGLLYDTIVLAALVSAGSDLYHRGVTEEQQAKLDKAKMNFSHDGGDSLTSLEVFKAWQAVEEGRKSKWCTENAINAEVIRGVRETVNDVCELLKREWKVEVTCKFSKESSTLENLAEILFRCNAANLCHFLGREKAGYFAAQASKRVFIHPSSTLCSLASYPEWVVFDELMQTSRDFITGITPVEDALVRKLHKEHCWFDVEEVRNKTLQDVFTLPVGSSAFYAVVGPCYKNLKKLQESIDTMETSSVIVLEANTETGEVKVLSTDTTDPSLKDIENKLKETVDSAVKELQPELHETAVGSEQSGVRVVMGQGAVITEILMPQETRKVFIKSPSDDAAVEAIRRKFQQYGEISECQQFQGRETWGYVVFRTADQAAAAVEGTQADEHDVAEPERRSSAKHNAELKASLSWIRRPGLGHAFVTVSPEYMSTCLGIERLTIGGRNVFVPRDVKRQNTLYLVDVPAGATEDQIKQAILRAIGKSEDAPNIVERVTIPRKDVGKTDNQKIKQLEDQIKTEISQHLSTSTVQVTVFPPKTETKVIFWAEAYFSDLTEGLKACWALHDKLKLDGAKVEVEPILRRVPQLVYDACTAELDKLITRLAGLKIEVVAKGTAGSSRLICCRNEGAPELIKARTMLSDVIKGEAPLSSGSRDFGHVLTSAGRQMLKETEQETSTYISVDNRLRTVSVHGSPQARTQASMKINRWLAEVISGQGEEMELRGDGRSAGLLKTLHVEYGGDLDALRKQAGLFSLEVDYRTHKLKLRGPQASIEQAKQVVEELDKGLKKSSAHSSKEKGDCIECVVCFCPIEKGDLYRLEACAHPLCKGCIVSQVNHAIRERNFPVTCCHKDCGLRLAWRDFHNLARRRHLEIPDLATSSLSHFVTANQGKARFCTTPDCPIVYRVSSERHAHDFLCPECNASTCTACHEHAHRGILCSVLQRYKGREIENWVREDPRNRRVCPSCSNGIEKIESCDKMRCKCGTTFCWQCTQQFQTPGECYDHLVKEHGGIFSRR